MLDDSAWDWPFLMYLATVPLRRSEKAFWQMTPRKLTSLGKAHAETLSSGDEENKESDVATEGPWKGQKYGFADQI